MENEERKKMKMKSHIALLCILLGSGCVTLEGPVFINRTGEYLRLEVVQRDGESYGVGLRPGGDVWQAKGRWARKPIYRFRLIGETSPERDYEMEPLLVHVGTRANAAILVRATDVEATTIQDAKRRGYLH